MGTGEHAALVRPVVAHTQERPEEHIAGMHLERKQRVNGTQRLVEAPQCDHGAEIAACTDECRGACELLRIHERHDAVARALGHLDEEREDDDHKQGHPPWLGIVDASEGKQEHALQEQGYELRPQAAGEGELGEQTIAQDATQGSSKEIHQPKAARQCGCRAALHLEVDTEVRRKLCIHGQLCSEACRVLEDHDHNAGVLQALQVVPHRSLRCLTRHRHVEPLGGGRVPAKQLHDYRDDQEEHGRDEHGYTPS
mmetsp:Transcript_41394/g.71746  ORF Transcript_41394/g.71746 Transcript_41394/m.71746 type:complete len:254 (-) Transcript_41394:146-907(-)